MTLDELIARAREQINARIALRNQYATELGQLRAADSPDVAKVDELRKKKADLDGEIERASTELSVLEDEKKRDDAVNALQARVTPVKETERTGETPANERGGAGAKVTEARTYSKEADPTGEKFLRDVVGGFLGQHGANERLARHMVEEKAVRGEVAVTRGVTTGDAPGLVVPQYLVDMYAIKGRPGRKFADQCRKHTLPQTGMEVYIPRQTAKTTVAEQTTELTDVSEDDYEDELISVRVRTASGSQTISRQTVERSLGTLDITVEDLLRAYDTNLDSMIINSATWGLLAVANSITYTDADPTAPELYTKILGGQANIEDTLQDLDEDDVFTLVRGRRWAWLKNQLTDKWPFIAAQGFPALAGGVSTGAGYAAGVRGHLPDGGDVVTDNNLPNNLGTGTNEDVAVVVARQEAHLWEDPSAPLYIRAEAGPSFKKLGIDLLVYGYFAFCANRVVDEQGTPKAVHQKITGTGLVAPVF